jgi:hypothetical protein
MRRMRRALAPTIALASILAFSCNNSYGIFQDVQGQTEQNGSDVFKKTPVSTAFRLNDRYYAATAKLYSRGVSDTSWTKVAIAGDSSYFLRSVVLVGGTIYALTGAENSQIALFAYVAGSWSQVGGIPGGKNLEALFTANNQLFAVSHSYVKIESTNTGTSYYDLYYFNGSSFVPVSGFTGLTDTIRGVAHDGVANYYFASENSIYTATDETNTAGSTSVGSVPHSIWSISYAGNHLYIAAQNGNLYRDGFAEMEDVSSSPLTVVTEVPSGPATKIILVGTDTDSATDAAEGYYEGTYGSLDVGSEEAIVAHSSSIYNTTVSSFPVHCLYWDPAAGNLFACVSPGTSSNTYFGLYKTHWDGSSWDGWEAE